MCSSMQIMKLIESNCECICSAAPVSNQTLGYEFNFNILNSCNFLHEMLQDCNFDDAGSPESIESGTRGNGGFIRIIKTLRIFKVDALFCIDVMWYWSFSGCCPKSQQEFDSGQFQGVLDMGEKVNVCQLGKVH